MSESILNPEHYMPERQVLALGSRLEPLLEILPDVQSHHEIEVRAKYGELQEGTPYEATEDEVIQNYFSFLAEVVEVASHDETATGRDMHELALQFSAETTYLSVEHTRTAVRGLASAQIDFLDTDQNHMLAFYIPRNATAKSQGLITHNVVSYIEADRPDLAPRVCIVGQDDEHDVAAIPVLSGKTKVVLVDDWIVTGNQMGYSLSHVGQLLNRCNRPDLANSVEINLLIARGDQMHDGFACLDSSEAALGIKQPTPIRAFYTSLPVSSPFAGPNPTGAHSTVDYGFSQRIAEMHRYLADRSPEDVPYPQLASIRKFH